MSTSTRSSKYTSSSGYASSYSSRGSYASRKIMLQHKNTSQATQRRHHQTSADDATWWAPGQFMVPGGSGASRQGVVKGGPTGWSYYGVTRVVQDDRDNKWDLTDSLADLYQELQRENENSSPKKKADSMKSVDVRKWLQADTNNGFVRVYVPDTNYEQCYLLPCTLNTPAHQLCLSMGIPPNSLHVQLNGDIIRRLDAHENPLVLQNEYLAAIGYRDIMRIQQEGPNTDLGYMIRFYTGKPFHDGTYSRNQLTALCYVKRVKVLGSWSRKLCSISGTRLFIFRDRDRNSTPSILQLVKGSVEDSPQKGHEYCLKLTSTVSGDRAVFLAFDTENDFLKWRRKCKKATSKLPTTADLSNCHLEFLPETIFINDALTMLNLRHNVLKERPIEEDIYTIGWLDDLARFSHLRSLNLADNNLACFPLAVCNMKTLVELNVASNKLTDIPTQIENLTNLQAFHIHNNSLDSLPEEMIGLKKLFILVLAFNKFRTIPKVVSSLSDIRIGDIENIIMAGNAIESLPTDLLSKLKYVKKIDFRMNFLTLTPSETMKFNALEQLTHLDIRDNQITDLDVRCLKTLEYLNCERCKMKTLQVHGGALKNLFAANNDVEELSIIPKPEWLSILDVSKNCLTSVAPWIVDCFFLQKLYLSHNRLTQLPDRIFADAKKLRILWADHNNIDHLPEDCDAFIIEELHIECNKITELPTDFFIHANKLRILNATSNRLMSLPDLNRSRDLNKLQELYLTSNFLQDKAMPIICGFTRLKILHLAHNDIYEIGESDIQQLELLQELNISGNKLKFLPESLNCLPDIKVIRAHSNQLRDLPDFRNAMSLKVLDVGCNRLLDASVVDLMSSKIDLLDMSCNTQMKVDVNDLKTVSRFKDVCLVDMTGQKRCLPGITDGAHNEELHPPWTVGFSESPGGRNKLCVSIFKDATYNLEDEALFAMFDGGHNGAVPSQLCQMLPSVLAKERASARSSDHYMKYTLLSCHRELKSSGQKLGASAAVCHIMKGDADKYRLEVGNVGDIEVVLSRAGEAVCLTQLHTVDDNLAERRRVCKAGGIITEDNKVNGTCSTTRQLGSSYLFPYVSPEPHVTHVDLRRQDQTLIIANRGLWKYVSYQEAVWEVQGVTNPVIATKRLQDIAQSYGSKENIAIVVVKFNMVADYLSRNRDSVGSQCDLADPLGLNTMSTQDAILVDDQMDVCDVHNTENNDNKEAIGGVTVKPLPRQRFVKKNACEEWEGILQRRISQELKDKELKVVTSIDEDSSAIEIPNRSPRRKSENWTSACIRRKQGFEISQNLNDSISTGNHAPRKVSLPPWLAPGLFEEKRLARNGDIINDGIHIKIEDAGTINDLNTISKHAYIVDADGNPTESNITNKANATDAISNESLDKPHSKAQNTLSGTTGKDLKKVSIHDVVEITDKTEIERLLSASSLGGLYKSDSVQSIMITRL